MRSFRNNVWTFLTKSSLRSRIIYFLIFFFWSSSCSKAKSKSCTIQLNLCFFVHSFVSFKETFITSQYFSLLTHTRCCVWGSFIVSNTHKNLIEKNNNKERGTVSLTDWLLASPKNYMLISNLCVWASNPMEDVCLHFFHCWLLCSSKKKTMTQYSWKNSEYR